MNWSRMLAIVSLPVAILLNSAPAAQAQQDCGGYCLECPDGFEGAGATGPTTGLFNPLCFVEVPYCVTCPPSLVTDDSPSFERITFLAGDAEAADLARLVKEYGDRLLVSTSRGVLVLRGSACSPDALAAVSRVDRARALYIARLGVPLLEEFGLPPATP